MPLMLYVVRAENVALFEVPAAVNGNLKEQVDMIASPSKGPILFYDEVRVDGLLMRLRDTARTLSESAKRLFFEKAAGRSDISALLSEIFFILQRIAAERISY
ncbi:hypothetical protein Salat_1616900 [Sesamum alatum]|uniref:Uncharacterized protein n=1 Tax=Sesamum alatum TaxID=300844 RepID=A0AAE2CJA3_9LAMI|nr:hypothetical protein Salat_1616900 [Sesamum alatum]